MRKGDQMALITRMKTIQFGHVSPQATIKELPDKLQLSVCGRKNEQATVRLMDSSGQLRSFFDEGFTTALEFTIPPDRESLEIDFAKPTGGECTFEVTTPAGTTLLRYLAA
jgi:hypothetical protein